MKLSRVAGLLAPIAALVACSSAPVDSPEATAKSKAELELQFCPGWSSCGIYGAVPTRADLVALGCTEFSTNVSYQNESYLPGSGEPLPEEGYFVQCPLSAESTLSPSCSYCLPGAWDGYFWYEWLTMEYRPCPSGCLKGPPVNEL